ncbi:MAG: hypothetical protein ACXVKQ_10170, partial [Acidimicrobiia bacterium]
MPGQRKKWKGLSFTDKLNILYKWVTGALFALVIVALIGLAVIFGIRSASDAISTDHKCAPLHHPAGEPTVKLCERRGSLENPNSLVLRTTEFINGLVL